jgi:2-octaprenyl-6-methoxyphenol hydroxylase
MKVNILGDGLVSLALAKMLVNEGIYVDLIYNNKIKKINEIRTIGITKTNMDFFNKKILNISKLSWEISKIEISLEKFEKKTLLKFGNNKKLFSIIKNYKLYNLLNNNLKKNKFFKKKKLPLSKSLDDNNQIIINCDSNSYISKKFFYNKLKKNYKSVAHVSIIKHRKIKNNNIAHQVFTKFGPIAFLPISESETSIVYSVKKTYNLNTNEIISLIKKNNPKYFITKFEKIENFELSSSNLRSYSHKNILAFGDLLHRVHPLAGQGFNMTLRDIKQLNKIITDRIDLGLAIDSSICFEFEKKLKHKNFLFSSGIDLIYEFFNFESKLKNNQLGKLVELIGKNKSLNDILITIADDGIPT